MLPRLPSVLHLVPWVLGALVGLHLVGPAPVCAQLATSPSPSLSDETIPPRSSERILQRPSDASLHHVVGGDATLYRHTDTSLPMGTLPLRTPVQRLSCDGDWCRVRTDEQQVGYVERTAISNVWIRVSKRDRRLYLHRGMEQIAVFNADFGYNAFADKEKRGSEAERDHWRTPNGTFFVVRKNPNSTFHKALVLNYPTAADARRGRRQGLISPSEHDAIVEAEANGTMPPMNTELGGWVEIHGDGTGAATNWTQGCVAVTNREMNRLWWWVEVGTPVVIE